MPSVYDARVVVGHDSHALLPHGDSATPSFAVRIPARPKFRTRHVIIHKTSVAVADPFVCVPDAHPDQNV